MPFYLEITDEFSNPGKMCASAIMLGSHGISILQVCVDFIIFQFGKVIFIGTLEGCLLTNGAPSTRNCPVAPESEKSQCEDHFRFGVFKLVAAIGSSCIWLDFYITLPDACLLVIWIGAGLQNSATLVISRANYRICYIVILCCYCDII